MKYLLIEERAWLETQANAEQENKRMADIRTSVFPSGTVRAESTMPQYANG